MNTKDLGHWETQLQFDPTEWFGFIYRITNLENQMEYIGRKYFFSKTRKKIKGRKNRKIILKESNWQKYTSSSKRINDIIEDQSKDIFKFEIIELCRTKGDLTYREVEIQWEEKVLSAKLENGDKKYYNNAIGTVRFQLSKHREETKKKMSQSAKGNTNAKGAIRSKETRKKMSIAKKGRIVSQTTRDKLSKINIGKKKGPCSEDTKKKISMANIGNNTLGCTIDGIEYSSRTSAAQALNIGRGVLQRRLMSLEYKNYIC